MEPLIYTLTLTLLMQLLLHVTYMAVFLAYAWSLKDIQPVAGRDQGPGSGQSQCSMPPPTHAQQGLMIALAIMTSDFLWQELRQVGGVGGGGRQFARGTGLPVSARKLCAATQWARGRCA